MTEPYFANDLEEGLWDTHEHHILLLLIKAAQSSVYKKTLLP